MVVNRYAESALFMLIVTSIPACTPQGPDIPQIVDKTLAFYSENRRELHEMRDTLVDHPLIYSVSVDLDVSDATNSKAFDNDARTTYLQIQSQCKTLGISVARASRVMVGSEKGRLISVDFFVFGIGWPDGQGVWVGYVPSESMIQKLKNEFLVRPTQDHNWFVVGQTE